MRVMALSENLCNEAVNVNVCALCTLVHVIVSVREDKKGKRRCTRLALKPNMDLARPENENSNIRSTRIIIIESRTPPRIQGPPVRFLFHSFSTPIHRVAAVSWWIRVTQIRWNYSSGKAVCRAQQSRLTLFARFENQDMKYEWYFRV